MILYDTTNEKSFDDVIKWINEVQRYKKGEMVKIIVGTKKIW